MSLSTLPDLCLFVIFDHLPIHDLHYSIAFVCTRWSSLHETACNRRTNLIVTESLDDLKSEREILFENVNSKIDFKSVLITSLATWKLESCVEFVKLFPNIKNLELNQATIPLRQLLKLQIILLGWSKQLESLKFKIRIEDDTEERDEEDITGVFQNNILSLIHPINLRMVKTLKRLDLDFELPDYFTGTIRLSISILASNLEYFRYRSLGLNAGTNNRRDVNVPMNEIQRYGQENANLREILLRNVASLDRLLQIRFEQAICFREVVLYDRLNLDQEILDNFELFCSRFTELNVLELHLGNCSLDQIVGHLSRNSRQLANLTLHINCEQDNHRIPVIAENVLPLTELSILPSVQALSLYVDTKSHFDISNLELATHFPGIQVVFIRVDCFRCIDCGYQLRFSGGEEMTNTEVAFMSRQCMRQSQRFGLCGLTMLKKVNLNDAPVRLGGFKVLELTKEELEKSE